MSRFLCVFCAVCCLYGIVYGKTALDEVPDENLLPFRMGNNPTYYGGCFDDANATILSAKGGLDGQRKKLPENHLLRWGYGIEIGDCKAANRVGVYDLIAYLATPNTTHSTNPANPENNPPLNLYKPIFVNGEANPENYWAYYVANVVKNYKSYARIYEVYNEPDYTDWRIPGKWETEPPKAEDLPHWRGSIFEYNRIMRITYEVVKKLDPTAWVTPGGLGYTSFLDAMLRYTDNPDDGSVTDEYPLKGGAYFDCLGYHQYPMYGVTDEKTGIGYHKNASDNLAMKFVTLKKNMEYRLEKYGFDGKTYPRKMFICTETGLSDVAFNNIGGDLVRRNYVIKQMLYAREYGIKQSHWFTVADTGGKDAYGHMGDFYPIKGKCLEAAEMKDSTKGRLVWNQLQLGKMDFDEGRTASTREMLNAIEDTPGHNFTAVVFKSNGKTSWTYSPNETLKEQPPVVYVFWRRSSEDVEIDEELSLSLKMVSPITVYKYDGTSETFKKDKFTIKVSSTPVFVVPSGDAASTSSVALSALLLLLASIFIAMM